MDKDNILVLYYTPPDQIHGYISKSESGNIQIQKNGNLSMPYFYSIRTQ